jgi:hypothetical protein
MDEKERAALIRKGNEFFNEGKIEDAAKVFIATKYRDGLTRVGDFFFFDKRMPLYAYKYYKLAERKDRIDDIFMRMMNAFKSLVKGEDGDKKEEPKMKVELPPLKVSPKLKIFAEEILRKNEEAQKAEK